MPCITLCPSSDFHLGDWRACCLPTSRRKAVRVLDSLVLTTHLAEHKGPEETSDHLHSGGFI